MRKAPLLFVFLVLILQATAQDKTLAQLRKELEEHPQEDAARVEKLINMAPNVFLAAPERRKLISEILSISRKINYRRGEAYALGSMATTRYLLGNFQEGDSLYNLAEVIAIEINDPTLIALTTLRKGTAKASVGDKEGMPLLYKAEKMFEDLKNYKFLARTQGTIASLAQVNFSNYPLAMEYLIKATESAEKANSSDEMFNVWSSLSSLHGYLGEQDSALVYMNKAIDAAQKGGGDVAKLQLLNNLGEIYRLTGKYSLALETYKKNLAADSALNTADILESNIADVYIRMDSLPLAFQYAFSSLAKATQINDEYILGWVNCVLARAYLKKAAPDSSIYHAHRGGLMLPRNLDPSN